MMKYLPSTLTHFLILSYLNPWQTGGQRQIIMCTAFLLLGFECHVTFAPPCTFLLPYNTSNGTLKLLVLQPIAHSPLINRLIFFGRCVSMCTVASSSSSSSSSVCNVTICCVSDVRFHRQCACLPVDRHILTAVLQAGGCVRQQDEYIAQKQTAHTHTHTHNTHTHTHTQSARQTAAYFL
jgi:hypothetical protein